MLGSFSLCCARWEWQKRAWTMQYTHREPNLVSNRPTRQRVVPSLSKAQRDMLHIPMDEKLPEGWELPDAWFKNSIPVTEERIGQMELAGYKPITRINPSKLDIATLLNLNPEFFKGLAR